MSEFHILLIEDEPASIDLMQEIVVQYPNCRLSVCQNSYEALNKLEIYDNDDDLPHMILLDLNLPGIHGREFLHILKTTESYQCIPVIVLSTSSNPDDIYHTYKMGANSYLCKPLDFDAFESMIQSMFAFWFGHVKFPPHKKPLRYSG